MTAIASRVRRSHVACLCWPRAGIGLLLWAGAGTPIPPVFPAETFEAIHAIGHFYAGDPAGAREWVARHRDVGGINYLALETCFGDMTNEALQSAELLATGVMPHFA